MSGTVCNFQNSVTREERVKALSEDRCYHCGATAKALKLRGQGLEICGEEFAYDLASGDRLLTPIALCPDCHADAHLDADHHHNPCQIHARRSREGLD